MATPRLPVLRPFDGPTRQGFPRYALCASCRVEILARSARETRCARCRIFAKVAVGAPSACWPWRGARSGGGYGMTRLGDGMVPAHRAVWQLTYAATALPQYVIRHRCDNPPCCNPAHLEIGTELQNYNDAVTRGRRARGVVLRHVTASERSRRVWVSRRGRAAIAAIEARP